MGRPSSIFGHPGDVSIPAVWKMTTGWCGLPWVAPWIDRNLQSWHRMVMLTHHLKCVWLPKCDPQLFKHSKKNRGMLSWNSWGMPRSHRPINSLWFRILHCDPRLSTWESKRSSKKKIRESMAWQVQFALGSSNVRSCQNTGHMQWFWIWGFEFWNLKALGFEVLGF